MTLSILVNGLWQGAIILGLGALLSRFFARDGAATRCAVWFIALLAVAFVPVVAVVWPLHLPALDSSVATGVPTRVRVTLIAISTAADTSWFAWPLLLLWQCGAVISLARLALNAIRVERIRRGALPVIVNGCAVLSSREICTPIAAGVFSPVVILPHDLLERLSDGDVDRVIAHERAHIGRNDVLANYIQRIVEAILWFNPAVYAIGHRIVMEREAACDDVAVHATGESQDYAVCLATLAQSIARQQTPVISPSVFGSRRALVARIERLLADGTIPKLAINRFALGAAATAFVAITVTLQSFSPVFAAGTPAQAGSSVAAACESTEAMVTNPAIPDLPSNVHPKRPTLLKVSIQPSGVISRIDMVQSSGDWKADEAASHAALKSTYKPATRNCKAVAGTYIFRVEYAPNP